MDELFMDAISGEPSNIKYLSAHEETLELCMEAVNKEPDVLKHINHQENKVCIAAIRKSPEVIKHVFNISPEVMVEAIRMDYKVVANVYHHANYSNLPLHVLAVMVDPRCIDHIRNPEMKTACQGIIENIKSHPFY